jgi:hypothetical protein
MLSGQVVVSGPLRGAAVSVDQIDYGAKTSVAVAAHVGDAMTDEDGHFELPDIGSFNGLLLITAKGGKFTDLATGVPIQLDPGTGLETIVDIDLLGKNDDVLVSPVGHLIAARTRGKMAEVGDVVMAEADAASILPRHFGNVPWSRMTLASLETKATSPTEPLRGALVQAALSFLAHDIAQASGASPQEVNVLTLTQKLATDVSHGVFDGDDGNNPAPGTGLELGVCGPVAGCTAAANDACALEACRPKCDLYSGTPRALLAGEMTKVIRDPTINKTDLVSGDILAVARSMADNADPALFAASACSETLDRLPPTLSLGEKPADGAFVHGTVQVTATATDDIDVPPAPAVEFVGYVDVDGDPHNNVATVMVDTTVAGDGPLTVTARTADAAGNAAMMTRTLQVDNTVPVVALDTTDATHFFLDATTLWTTDAQPVLHGTFVEAHPSSVEAVVGMTRIPGTLDGATWSVDFTTSGVRIDPAGTDIRIAVTDAAGNQGTTLQHVRFDGTPPAITFPAKGSEVSDEAAEIPTFAPDGTPIHTHGGTAVDLATGTAEACKQITKFSYLLGSGPPPYGNEVGGQNPLTYRLQMSDDGVGIQPGSTQYRVGRGDPSGPSWITGPLPMPGTPVPSVPGTTSHEAAVYSDTVSGLDTTEGIYVVEFQATDKFGRVAVQQRCFDLHLRAPPLHFQTPGSGTATDPDPLPVGHKYRLASLTLGAGQFNAIAARLLNNDATGASLIDEDVTNGTASTVYLTVAVTRPSNVWAGQIFTLSFVDQGTTGANITCTTTQGQNPPSICHQPSTPLYTSAANPDGTPAEQVEANPSFPVKVFEFDANGPTTETPCIECGTSDGTSNAPQRWKFAIPPRAGASTNPQPARRFKVMTMIGQAQHLWPSDGNFATTPPFLDIAIGATQFTGRTGGSIQGCTVHSTHQIPGGMTDICTQVKTILPYRALKKVHLRIDPTAATYATAPTSTGVPIQGASARLDQPTWDSAQGSLP